ncbi:MAG: Spy/CpxP family protein refolding chaperone [bacterium]
MRTKWLILGTAVLLAIGAAQMGYAQRACGFGPGRGLGDGPGDGPGILAKAEALDLKPDQVERIQAMRLDLAKTTLQIRSELELKRLELRELMLADKPDRRGIEAKIDEIEPLRTELQKKRIEHRLALREVLTPEQRAKLKLWLGPGKRRPDGRRGWHRG